MLNCLETWQEVQRKLLEHQDLLDTARGKEEVAQRRTCEYTRSRLARCGDWWWTGNAWSILIPEDQQKRLFVTPGKYGQNTFRCLCRHHLLTELNASIYILIKLCHKTLGVHTCILPTQNLSVQQMAFVALWFLHTQKQDLSEFQYPLICETLRGRSFFCMSEPSGSGYNRYEERFETIHSGSCRKCELLEEASDCRRRAAAITVTELFERL